MSRIPEVSRVRRARRGIRACAILAGLLIVASAAPARATTLLELSRGGTIVSGDKIFSNFHNITQSGTLSVALDRIDVVAITGGANDEEFGIRFQSADWQLIGANKSYDLAVDFTVQRLDGARLIEDNTLEITGAITGNAAIAIAEGVTDHQDDSLLANKLVFINPNGTRLIDHKVFTHLAAIVDVSKDFSMTTGNDPTAVAFVSHFDQTFSQASAVPEPSTFASLGFGLLFAFGSRRRQIARLLRLA